MSGVVFTPERRELTEDQKELHHAMEAGLSLLETIEDEPNLSPSSQAAIGSVRRLITHLARMKTSADSKIRDMEVELETKQAVIRDLNSRVQSRFIGDGIERPSDEVEGDEDDQEDLESLVHTANPLAGQVDFGEQLQKTKGKLREALKYSKALMKKNAKLSELLEEKNMVIERQITTIHQLEADVSRNAVQETPGAQSKFFVEPTQEGEMRRRLRNQVQELETEAVQLRNQNRDLKSALEKYESRFASLTGFGIFATHLPQGDTRSLGEMETDPDRIEDLPFLRRLVRFWRQKAEKTATDLVILHEDYSLSRRSMQSVENRLSEALGDTKALEAAVSALLESQSSFVEVAGTDLREMPKFGAVRMFQSWLAGIFEKHDEDIQELNTNRQRLEQVTMEKNLELMELRNKNEIILAKYKQSEQERYDRMRDRLSTDIESSRQNEVRFLERISKLQAENRHLRESLSVEKESVLEAEAVRDQAIRELDEATESLIDKEKIIREEARSAAERVMESSNSIYLELQDRQKQLEELVDVETVLNAELAEKRSALEKMGLALIGDTISNAPVVEKYEQQLKERSDQERLVRATNRALEGELKELRRAVRVYEDCIREQEAESAALRSTVSDLLSHTTTPQVRRDAERVLLQTAHASGKEHDTPGTPALGAPSEAATPIPARSDSASIAAPATATAHSIKKVKALKSTVKQLHSELSELRKQEKRSEKMKRKLTTVAELLNSPVAKKADGSPEELIHITINELRPDSLELLDDAGKDAYVQNFRSYKLIVDELQKILLLNETMDPEVVRSLAQIRKTQLDEDREFLLLFCEQLQADVRELCTAMFTLPDPDNPEQTAGVVLLKSQLAVLQERIVHQNTLIEGLQKSVKEKDSLVCQYRAKITHLETKMDELASQVQRQVSAEIQFGDDVTKHLLEKCVGLQNQVSTALRNRRNIYALLRTESPKLAQLFQSVSEYGLLTRDFSLDTLNMSSPRLVQKLLGEFIERLSLDITYVLSYTSCVERSFEEIFMKKEFYKKYAQEVKQVTEIHRRENAVLRDTVLTKANLAEDHELRPILEKCSMNRDAYQKLIILKFSSLRLFLDQFLFISSPQVRRDLDLMFTAPTDVNSAILTLRRIIDEVDQFPVQDVARYLRSYFDVLLDNAPIGYEPDAEEVLAALPGHLPDIDPPTVGSPIRKPKMIPVPPPEGSQKRETSHYVTLGGLSPIR